VRLRAAEPRDLPAIEAGIHDHDVIRWIGPQPPSAHDLLMLDEEWWAKGSPTLSIWLEVHQTDPSIGSVGYWLLAVGRGRGLATGAVRLLSAWAIRELGVTNVRIRTAPDNQRSQRVAERSGFRRVSPTAGEPPDGPDGGQVVFVLDGLQQ